MFFWEKMPFVLQKKSHSKPIVTFHWNIRRQGQSEDATAAREIMSITLFASLCPVLSLSYPPRHTSLYHTVGIYCVTVFYTFLWKFSHMSQIVSASFLYEKNMDSLFIIYFQLYSLVVTDISKHVNDIKMHFTVFTKHMEELYKNQRNQRGRG